MRWNRADLDKMLADSRDGAGVQVAVADAMAAKSLRDALYGRRRYAPALAGQSIVILKDKQSFSVFLRPLHKLTKESTNG